MAYALRLPSGLHIDNLPLEINHGYIESSCGAGGLSAGAGVGGAVSAVEYRLRRVSNARGGCFVIEARDAQGWRGVRAWSADLEDVARAELAELQRLAAGAQEGATEG